MRPALDKQTPPALNDRQRHYLLAAYQLDQAIERQRKRNFAQGMVDDARTPAAEWRAMAYGRWQHNPGQPPTPLREALAPNLVSPGPGSTWKALAERRLVEVDDRTIQFLRMLLREQYGLPHVSLTRAGRKLARELLGEVRETAKPSVLAPDTWQALARLWEWPPRPGALPAGGWQRRHDGRYCLGSLAAPGAPAASAHTGPLQPGRSSGRTSASDSQR